MLEEGKDYEIMLRPKTRLWDRGLMFTKIRIAKINMYGVLCHTWDESRYAPGRNDHSAEMIQINYNEIDTIMPLR